MSTQYLEFCEVQAESTLKISNVVKAKQTFL